METYSELQMRVDAHVRDVYFQDYPDKLNKLINAMKRNKRKVIADICEVLSVEVTKENSKEIETIVWDILYEEIEE